MPPIKVLVIEDHDDFRSIVRTHLEGQDWDLEIIEAESGELGIIHAIREKPEIILMDIRLPEINGIEAASRIKKDLPNSHIIILTMFETESFRQVFRSDDITAYIGKSELYDELVPIIEKLLNPQSKFKAGV